MSREDRAALAVLVLVAIALRAGAATVSPNVLWPDEIFQSLEQAHRLAFGVGLVPWEFRDGARSWLLPGALAAIVRVTAPFGPGSSGYLAGARVALSACAAVVPAAVFVVARRDREVTRLAAAAAASVPLLWFELVYFAPKALGEVVGAHALIAATLLAPSPLACGAALGAAVALRVHLAPAALAIVLVEARRGRAWLGRAAGAGAAIVAIAGLLDLATWGAPFHSYVANVRANVSEGRAAAYGTSDPSGYVRVLARVWGPAGIAFAALAIVGARRAPALAVACVVAFATHHGFAHKEYRFVYPAIAAAAALAGLGVAEIGARAGRHATGIALAVALAICGLSGWRATLYTWSAQSLVGASGEPDGPLWRHLRGALRAYDTLSREADVCGVALEGRRWNRTGGYAYLHRDVPVFELLDDAAWRRYRASFNAIVAGAGGPERVADFRRERCLDGVCVYRRPGGCVRASGYPGPLLGPE